MTNNINHKQRIIPVALLVVLLFSNRFVTVYAADYDCPAGEHEYTVVTADPTEDHDGKKTYTCSICGYTYSQTLPATGHIWSEWVTDKEPACTREGHRYRVCTRFGHDSHLQEETIPALDHNYKEETIPADCEQDGKAIYTCERCGDTYEKAGEKAIGHSYTEKLTAFAGCEEDGKKEYTCEHCGKVYTEIIPAFGHDYGVWETVREPAVDETGLKQRVCLNDSSHIIEETIEPLLPEPEPDTNTDWISYIIISVGAIPFSLVGFSAFRDCQVLRWKRRKTRLHLLEISKGERL